MRKTLLIFLFLIGAVFAPLPTLAADDLSLNCKSALLLDAANGTVLYEQNSTERCYPASITKLMTLVLAFEALNAGTVSEDETVPVSPEAAGMGGSQVYLYPGEERSFREMLLAIAVGSGNDAAYAMAEFLGGTLNGFVEQMNEKAAELGMTGTHFVNPHGLHDDDHYTTAADLGKLALYAVRIPGMLELTSTYEYEFRPAPKQLLLWNTNRLLKWYEGTDGLKTGYTPEAGRNLVATVCRDDMRLISVVLGCEERQGHFNESMKLLNYGFNQYEAVVLHRAGDTLAEIPVSKGLADSVPVTVAGDICYVQKKGIQHQIEESMELHQDATAPVNAGDSAGTLQIRQDGQELLSAELIYADSVEKAGFTHTWRKLLEMIW